MSGAPALPAPFVDQAAALVRERTGLVIGAARSGAFHAALVEAMDRARVSDPVVYLADLAGAPALVDDLAGRVTVGETYFFREPEQWAVIEQEILPALLRSPAPDRGSLSLWSAGCATGEEPYTLAIVVSRLGAAARSRILGTDLNRVALARARRARYARWSLRGVQADVVGAYFRPAGERYDLAPALRSTVEFRYLNLAGETYPSPASGIGAMDLILCRNVLIYFDRETIARVAARLVASLAPGGWLLLGASDPLLAELVPCEAVVTRAGLAYRRPAEGHEPVGRVPAAAASPEKLLPALQPEPVALVALEPERVEPAAAAAAQASPVPVRDPARWYAERDYERAAEAARRAIARDGADPEPWVVLVRALADSGESSGAESACAAAVERHPTSAELRCLHALLLNEARQYEAGEVAARRALYLDRGLVAAHLARGAALSGLRDPRGARRAFRAAAKLLADLPADAVVPASGGESAGRLAELVCTELELLREAPA